ncbi:MAG: hypothetical protein WCK47_00825 [bacterium]
MKLAFLLPICCLLTVFFCGCRRAAKPSADQVRQTHTAMADDRSTTQPEIIGSLIMSGNPVLVDTFPFIVLLAPNNQIRIYPQGGIHSEAVAGARGTVMIDSAASVPVALKRSPNNKYVFASFPSAISAPTTATVSMNVGVGDLKTFEAAIAEITNLEDDLATTSAIAGGSRDQLWINLNEQVRKLEDAVESNDTEKLVMITRQIESYAKACADSFGDSQAARFAPILSGFKDAVDQMQTAVDKNSTDAYGPILELIRDKLVRSLGQ